MNVNVHDAFDIEHGYGGGGSSKKRVRRRAKERIRWLNGVTGQSTHPVVG